MMVPGSTPAPVQSQVEGSTTRMGAAVHSQLPNMPPTIAFSGRFSGGSRQRVVTCAGSVEVAGSRLANSLYPIRRRRDESAKRTCQYAELGARNATFAPDRKSVV